MITTEPDSRSGLGIFVDYVDEYGQFYSHTGLIYGYSSWMYYNLDKDAVVCANISMNGVPSGERWPLRQILDLLPE